MGTQVDLVERTIKYPTLSADFSTTQILGGHVTSLNQGLCSNDQGRQRRETLGTRLPAADYWTDDVKVQPAAGYRIVDRKKNLGRDCVIFVSPKMGASRFKSLTEENIAQVLNDKDSENTII